MGFLVKLDERDSSESLFLRMLICADTAWSSVSSEAISEQWKGSPHLALPVCRKDAASRSR